MKQRKHKDKMFILRFLNSGDRNYRSKIAHGNDAASVAKGFLFGQDLSKIQLISVRPV